MTHETLPDFLARLSRIGDPAAQAAAFRQAILDHDGTLVLPQGDTAWGPHLVELSLFGLHEAGATEGEALANWLALARDHLDRQARLAAAEAKVRRPGRADPVGELRAACETVRSLSTDPSAIEAARRMAGAIAAGWLK